MIVISHEIIIMECIQGLGADRCISWNGSLIER